MSDTNKIILSVVLIILACGIFYWHFSSQKKKGNSEEPQTALLNLEQAKALETIFGKIGSKKWSDPSLYTNPKTAQSYSALAEKLFTSSPSMSDIKILGYGEDKMNNDAPFLILEVPTTEMAISVTFSRTKTGQLVIDRLLEGEIKAKDYKKRK
ncbi:MAG: hypothetical protein J6Y80_06765 [Victivallales bacterium]|nr:hypothetical protein [Victivallales bacterium]